MARTIDSVIQQARTVLKDARQPYRSDDDRLLSYLNTAFEDAYRMRPDLFLPTLIGPPTYTDADLTASTEFPLEAQFISPFIDYVVGYVSASDDEFVNDQRALAFLNRFSQKLIAKGA